MAASDVQTMTGISSQGLVPHDIPNRTRPITNSAALWIRDRIRNGIVFPASSQGAETGAIRNRRNVPNSRSLMNERAITFTRKNANITV